MSNIRIDSIKTMDDVRGALQAIKDEFVGSALFKGEFSFFEISLLSAVSNLKYTHNLKFQPKDIIQISCLGPGTVTWNYANFTKTTLDITSTGACVVRAYIGRHREGSDV